MKFFADLVSWLVMVGIDNLWRNECFGFFPFRFSSSFISRLIQCAKLQFMYVNRLNLISFPYSRHFTFLLGVSSVLNIHYLSNVFSPFSFMCCAHKKNSRSVRLAYHLKSMARSDGVSFVGGTNTFPSHRRSCVVPNIYVLVPPCRPLLYYAFFIS